MEDFPDAPCPRKRYGAKVKNPAEYALVHGDGFHLPQEQLQRSAAQQTHFDDDSFVRHTEFGGSIFDKGAQPDEQSE